MKKSFKRSYVVFHLTLASIVFVQSDLEIFKAEGLQSGTLPVIHVGIQLIKGFSG